MTKLQCDSNAGLHFQEGPQRNTEGNAVEVANKS